MIRWQDRIAWAAIVPAVQVSVGVGIGLFIVYQATRGALERRRRRA